MSIGQTWGSRRKISHSAGPPKGLWQGTAIVGLALLAHGLFSGNQNEEQPGADHNLPLPPLVLDGTVKFDDDGNRINPLDNFYEIGGLAPGQP